MPKYTAVEERILAVFEDGRKHPIQDFVECLHDSEMGSTDTVWVHFYNLRRKLQPIGQNIRLHVEGVGKTRKCSYTLVRYTRQR